VVTRHSCEQMELAKGVEAIAMIQASAIMLALPTDGLQISARNQLRGYIREIETGTVNNVVTANMADQLTLCASLTRNSTEQMQLKIDDEIVMLIKASNIVLGRLR
jgi:molybdate transport system regulatory protein